MNLKDVQSARRLGVQRAMKTLSILVLGAIFLVLVPTFAVVEYAGFRLGMLTMLVGFGILAMLLFRRSEA